MNRVTDFARFHSEGIPISMLTCYDAWSAKLLAGTDIDALLVGDSVANVMHGFPDTTHATVQMMVDHTSAVRRGIGAERFVVTDVPFPEHRKGRRVALECVERLVRAGANAVKIEGVAGHLDTIAHIVESGVPVMGHLGLTPQSVHLLGGHRLQGTTSVEADRIEQEAFQLQAAGVFAIVLECIPAGLAQRLSELLEIPTIGIGSGVHCSGQVLVLQDLLGMNLGFRPRFLRTYMAGGTSVTDAVNEFNRDVKERRYPSAKESWHVSTAEHQ
jgi:3-methyl-2-oxobutanoate hydroxymethyltransferase